MEGAAGAERDASSIDVRRLVAFVASLAALGAISGGALALLDGAVRGPFAPVWLPAVFGVGAFAGALSAMALALLLCLSGMLRHGGVRAALWLLAGAGCALFLIDGLGVLARLHGPYGALAWTALASIVALALGGALVLAALTPDLGRGPDRGAPYYGGLLARWPPSLRRGYVALLLAFVLVAIVLDARLFVDTYPLVHEVMRRSARLALTAALFGAALPRAQRVAWLAVPLFVLSLVVFGASHDALASALRTVPFLDIALRDAEALTDFDGDGVAAWPGAGDCAPFDADVHPGRAEVAGNGRDDNCRLGDARAAYRHVSPVLKRPAPDAPRVSFVLITIDALRADHLGSYGYARATSPHVDRWFAEGLRFVDAIAPGAYTAISIPALLRGVYPRHLPWSTALQTDTFRLLLPGASPELRPGEAWLNAHRLSLGDQVPPLPLMLAALGYRTAAIVDDGGSGFLSQPVVGLGFERFRYMPAEAGRLWDPEGDRKVADAALAQLEAQDGRPFFLWLHFYGVHAPDARHDEVATFGDDVVAAYDHEVAYVDAQLDRVFARLADLERERPLVTVLTADHGERFAEGGRAHGTVLDDEELRVPLFVRGTGVARGQVDDVVSLVDLVPSLLHRVGASEGVGFDGVDLFSAEARTRRSAVLADVWRYGARGLLEFERSAALGRAHRFVFEPASNARLLYPRGRDQAPLFSPDEALERTLFEYLELTGPSPGSLLGEGAP